MIRSAVRAVFVTFAIFVLLVLSVAVTRAQDTTGTILGTVVDSSGGVLPGVTVEARSPSKMLTSLLLKLAVARSEIPSPLKSPATMEIP